MALEHHWTGENRYFYVTGFEQAAFVDIFRHGKSKRSSRGEEAELTEARVDEESWKLQLINKEIHRSERLIPVLVLKLLLVTSQRGRAETFPREPAGTTLQPDESLCETPSIPAASSPPQCTRSNTQTRRLREFVAEPPFFSDY